MSPVNKTGICSIELAGNPGAAPPDHILREQKQALQGLLANNNFQVQEGSGPYAVTLAVMDGRLVIGIKCDVGGQSLNTLVLSLRPYKRLIQDYFLMMDSYEKARRFSTPEKLEAIDMGRRAIHNDGADLLMSRMKGKIEMDHETARKFFTLVCALHESHVRLAV